jgi:hypothetical protein
VNTGALLPITGSGYFTDNASCTGGRPLDVLMESRMRRNSQVQFGGQRRGDRRPKGRHRRLAADPARAVLDAEHRSGRVDGPGGVTAFVEKGQRRSAGRSARSRMRGNSGERRALLLAFRTEGLGRLEFAAQRFRSATEQQPADGESRPPPLVRCISAVEGRDDCRIIAKQESHDGPRQLLSRVLFRSELGGLDFRFNLEREG